MKNKIILGMLILGLILVSSCTNISIPYNNIDEIECKELKIILEDNYNCDWNWSARPLVEEIRRRCYNLKEEYLKRCFMEDKN